jgi:uncharacterized protein
VSVFIDTAVIMYAAGKEHPLRDVSRDTLKLAASGQLDAVTSAEVIQEILHRFTALQRRNVGADMARNAMDLFAPVLPITHGVMQRMPHLVERYEALVARDLVHVATCLEHGVEAVITPDQDFDLVDEIQRIAPQDRVSIERFVR